jgi:hypothetical protein
MAEIINLRRFRKDKERNAKEKDADENRRRFGLPKSERERVKAEKDLTARRLDAHKLDDEPPSSA